jgi:glycosyltransferase involved in cell wall biosynthesis
VSVVIATWNASHLLRYAIASVLHQDHPHFEILVVGDHCTDDTEAVVASFGDLRIRFTNLERNSGQQATPNNLGVAAARGEYLAFLNHDDMYLPHHLSSCIERLRRTGADILCCTHATIPPEQQAKLDTGELVAIGDGFEPSGRFSPRTFHVASSWFLRRDAAVAVGPWRLEDETWVTPSQEWLFRAWRIGRRIDWTRDISVVAIFSGGRRDSYRKRDSREHELVFQNVVATDRLRGAMIASAQAWIDAKLRPKPAPWPRRLEQRVRAARDDLVANLLIGVGLHPRTRAAMKRWGWRRGSKVRKLREFTGAEHTRPPTG